MASKDKTNEQNSQPVAGVSRRQVLRGMAAAAVVGPAWVTGCGSEPEDTPPDKPATHVEPISSGSPAATCADPAGKSAKITHGPLTGGVTDGRIVISARLDGPASVRFRLKPKGGGAELYTDCVLAEKSQDYAVRLVMSDLPADSRYDIFPEVDGSEDASHAISCQTFPTAGTVAALSFAFGACQRHNDKPTDVISAGKTYDVIADLKEQPLFFCQTGDWTYPDYDFAPSSGGGFAGVDADGNNYTVFPEHLAKSYHKRLDPDYPMTKVLNKVPLAHVWDDHDFAQNNAWSGVAGKQSDRVDAFERYLPSYALPKSRGGVWQQFSAGHCDFWLVDMRSQRTHIDEAVKVTWSDDGNAITAVEFSEPPGHTMLGAEQLDWLIDSLKASTATWKFIFFPIEINPYYSKFLDLGIEIMVPMVLNAVGDGYAGYPTERDKILELHKSGAVKNMVFLTGDSHEAAMRKGTADCPPIFMAAALDINKSPLMGMVRTLGPKFGLSVDEAWTEWWQGKGGKDADEDRNGFGRIRVITEPGDKLICECIDFEGKTLHTMEVEAV